ncbi:glycosyltransferase family 2 protein [Alienimonas californiensis]|uniref:4,4'-diaponeurosporenoate glycosyltransferase n=1 Tax=Alienimonas californiensis TaxID=2527989 RepID=A0A517P8K8_9PLAN|nr:glycosyltransferase family 2 protein [Alienimonas californiensis]QDT15707.1 4,4'-diaponeurosporenoate glycosyltransferase [Alienimonas californiensis]
MTPFAPPLADVPVAVTTGGVADWIAWGALVCSALPAGLTLLNLFAFRPPKTGETTSAAQASRERQPPERAERLPRLSLLIPARNEAAGIGECLHAALSSKEVDLEIVVLDDHSTDGTGEIVAAAAREDGRVRLEQAPPLPAGWCGKQWACRTLADRADPSRDVLCFIDADVRLAPHALRTLCEERARKGVGLLGGFPREACGTPTEAAVIPLIHFVLLGFLPIAVARRLRGPAWAAGCGQLFLTTRSAYAAAGGHDAVKASLHDGLTLPRAYRAAGQTTDVVDAAELAVCRMYHGAAETFAGLSKNATEGVAAPGLIGFFTLVLGLGQVAPIPLLIAGGLGLATFSAGATAALWAAAALSFGTRAALALAFRQPWRGVALHPLGVAFFLVVQWTALGRKLLGRPAAWRGRSYASAAPSPAPAAVLAGPTTGPRRPARRPAARPALRGAPPFTASPRPGASASAR